MVEFYVVFPFKISYLSKFYPLVIKKHDNTLNTRNKLQICAEKLPTTDNNPNGNPTRPKKIVK